MGDELVADRHQGGLVDQDANGAQGEALMPVAPRTSVLWKGVLSGTSNNYVRQVPASTTFIMRQMDAITNAAGWVELIVTDRAASTYVQLAHQTADANYLVHWTGWVALNDGAYIVLRSNLSANVHVWVSGSVLTGDRILPLPGP